MPRGGGAVGFYTGSGGNLSAGSSSSSGLGTGSGGSYSSNRNSSSSSSSSSSNSKPASKSSTIDQPLGSNITYYQHATRPTSLFPSRISPSQLLQPSRYIPSSQHIPYPTFQQRLQYKMKDMIKLTSSTDPRTPIPVSLEPRSSLLFHLTRHLPEEKTNKCLLTVSNKKDYDLIQSRLRTMPQGTPIEQITHDTKAKLVTPRVAPACSASSESSSTTATPPPSTFFDLSKFDPMKDTTTITTTNTSTSTSTVTTTTWNLNTDTSYKPVSSQLPTSLSDIRTFNTGIPYQTSTIAHQYSKPETSKIIVPQKGSLVPNRYYGDGYLYTPPSQSSLLERQNIGKDIMQRHLGHEKVVHIGHNTKKMNKISHISTDNPGLLTRINNKLKSMTSQRSSSPPSSSSHRDLRAISQRPITSTPHSSGIYRPLSSSATNPLNASSIIRSNRSKDGMMSSNKSTTTTTTTSNHLRDRGRYRPFSRLVYQSKSSPAVFQSRTTIFPPERVIFPSPGLNKVKESSLFQPTKRTIHRLSHLKNRAGESWNKLLGKKSSNETKTIENSNNSELSTGNSSFITRKKQNRSHLLPSSSNSHNNQTNKSLSIIPSENNSQRRDTFRSGAQSRRRRRATQSQSKHDNVSSSVRDRHRTYTHSSRPLSSQSSKIDETIDMITAREKKLFYADMYLGYRQNLYPRVSSYINSETKPDGDFLDTDQPILSRISLIDREKRYQLDNNTNNIDKSEDKTIENNRQIIFAYNTRKFDYTMNNLLNIYQDLERLYHSKNRGCRQQSVSTSSATTDTSVPLSPPSFLEQHIGYAKGIPTSLLTMNQSKTVMIALPQDKWWPQNTGQWSPLDEVVETILAQSQSNKRSGSDLTKNTDGIVELRRLNALVDVTNDHDRSKLKQSDLSSFTSTRSKDGNSSSSSLPPVEKQQHRKQQQDQHYQYNGYTLDKDGKLQFINEDDANGNDYDIDSNGWFIRRSDMTASDLLRKVDSTQQYKDGSSVLMFDNNNNYNNHHTFVDMDKNLTTFFSHTDSHRIIPSSSSTVKHEKKKHDTTQQNPQFSTYEALYDAETTCVPFFDTYQRCVKNDADHQIRMGITPNNDSAKHCDDLMSQYKQCVSMHSQPHL